MKLESGPARADRNWQTVRAVLFFGFSLWFAYDGAIGWPNENREMAEQRLKDPHLFRGEKSFDDLGDKPDEDIFQQLVASKPTTLEQVHEFLGRPTVSRHEEGGGVVTEFFASRYGYASLRVNNGRPEPASLMWIKWYKGKAELRLQFYIAAIPLPFGLYFLRRLYKAVTLRVVIDDEGMIYDGRRIAFTDMVSFRDYSPKGWIDLYHKAGAEEKKLRLDHEKVKLFDEIVAAICAAKGFENEVEAYAKQKAREEASPDDKEE
ncbi:MAG: hypothetical protein KAY37_03465 [Phycisphaerae bacterium]|nr:hypothetical protein [Phycisphaerae bacterium]